MLSVNVLKDIFGKRIETTRKELYNALKDMLIYNAEENHIDLYYGGWITYITDKWSGDNTPQKYEIYYLKWCDEGYIQMYCCYADTSDAKHEFCYELNADTLPIEKLYELVCNCSKILTENK